MQTASIVNAMSVFSQPQVAKSGESVDEKGLGFKAAVDQVKPMFASEGQNEEVALDGQKAQANLLDLLLAVVPNAGQTRNIESEAVEAGSFGFVLAKTAGEGDEQSALSRSVDQDSIGEFLTPKGKLNSHESADMAISLGRFKGGSRFQVLRMDLPEGETQAYLERLKAGEEDGLHGGGNGSKISGIFGQGNREGGGIDGAAIGGGGQSGSVVGEITNENDLVTGSKGLMNGDRYWKGIRERDANGFKNDLLDLTLKFQGSEKPSWLGGVRELLESQGIEVSDQPTVLTKEAGKLSELALGKGAEKLNINMPYQIEGSEISRDPSGFKLDHSGETERQVGLAEWFGSKAANGKVQDLLDGKLTAKDFTAGQFVVSNTESDAVTGRAGQGAATGAEVGLGRKVATPDIPSESIDVDGEEAAFNVTKRGPGAEKLGLGEAGQSDLSDGDQDSGAELKDASGMKFSQKLDGEGSEMKFSDAIRTERTLESSRAERLEQVLDAREPKKMAQEVGDLIAARRPGRFAVKLFPEAMGEIHVAVKHMTGAVDVQLMASDDRISRELSANRGELVNAIERNGVTVNQVSVAKEAGGADLNAGQGGQEAKAGTDEQGRQNSGRATREDFDRAVAMSGGTSREVFEAESVLRRGVEGAVDYTV